MADERLTVPVEIVPGTEKQNFEKDLATKYADAEVKVKVSPEIDTKAKSPQTLEAELNKKYQNIKLNISIAEKNSETIKIFATNLAQAVANKLKAELEGTPINVKTKKDDDSGDVGSSGGAAGSADSVKQQIRAQLNRFKGFADIVKNYAEPLYPNGDGKNDFYKKYADALATSNFDTLLPQTDDELKDFLKNLKEYNAHLQNSKQAAFQVTAGQRQDSRKANMARQAAVYLDTNSKIMTNRDLYGRWGAYISKASSPDYTADELQKELAELKKETQELGLETVSLSGKLKKLFNEHMKTAMVMALINAFRQLAIRAVQDIIAIDDAMTELKKVTDETSLSYEHFLDRAADKAQILGSTIADVVTATADFARLGYNLSESEDLAAAALVYKNVGDGIEDISVASQSIISTMKAFGYSAEQAMSIVDKFNKVGKINAPNPL